MAQNQTFEQSIVGGDVSLPTSTDFSSKQYYLVDVDANGNAILPTADGQRVVGALQDAINGSAYPGAATSVRALGVTKCVASAAIAAGDDVTAVNGGQIKTAVVGSVSGAATVGSRIFGRALSTATQAGDLVAVLIQQQGAAPTTPA
jgi:hypothetical protein